MNYPKQIKIVNRETNKTELNNVFNLFEIFDKYIILDSDKIGDEIGSEIETLIDQDNEFCAEDVYCRCEQYTNQIREELINEVIRFINENGLSNYCKDVI